MTSSKVIPKKQIAFTDQRQCIDATELLIENSYYPFAELKTRDEMVKILYPKIDFFHAHKKVQRNLVPSDKVRHLLRNQKLAIYKNTNADISKRTLEYMFDNFNRFVFVQIMNNQLVTFTIVTNKNKTISSDIVKNIKIDPTKYKNKDDFVRALFATHHHYRKVERWQDDSIYHTDCILNLWKKEPKPIMYEDWQLFNYQYDLLERTLKHKKVNDIEFILNDKDQQILLSNGDPNPHYHILNKATLLVRSKIQASLPVLNFSAHSRFADIPIPTNDDWEIITNKYFLGSCRDLYIDIKQTINTNYDSKIPTAIFRGSSTGCGTTIKNNPRLKLAYLSKKYKDHPRYRGMLDAQITKFTKTVKKHYSDKYISYTDPKQLRLKPSKKISIGTISNYKYVINVEGNIAAFRLTLELSFNSVILLVSSNFSLWYQPLLQPWVHYVPVKADLSDLMDKIAWCKSNDSKCKEIASNALSFYNTYMNETFIYEYMQALMI